MLVTKCGHCDHAVDGHRGRPFHGGPNGEWRYACPCGCVVDGDLRRVVAAAADADSPDAMRLDASRAEADAELAEWRALLDAAKGRR